MQRYRQHCPIARTSELLGQSWTLLILRELSRRANRLSDIASGVPGMTEPLLVTRLRTLEAAGVVRRLPNKGSGSRYQLTVAGLELRPVLERLGSWGQRWLPAPGIGDFDARLLIREICDELDVRLLPQRPVGVRIDLVDANPRLWWLTLARTGATAHETDPGVEVAVRVEATIGALTNAWLGHSTWLQAVRDKDIVLTGQRATTSSVLGWIGTSRYAAVRRAAPAAGGT